MDIFKESHKTAFLGPSSKEGKEWDVVIIESGLSLNGTFYPADVLKSAIPLFEGMKACAYRFGEPLDSKFNHLPGDVSSTKPGGFVENVVGWFEKVRYGTFKRPDGTQGEGVLGRFHVMEGAAWLRKNLKDAWEHGKHAMLGFSIDAQGSARAAMVQGKRVKLVDKIASVESTDVVSQPAAGGGVLRLVAGIEELTMKNLYETIKQHRGIWLDGFAEPNSDDDMDSHVKNILESTLTDNTDKSPPIFGTSTLLRLNSLKRLRFSLLSHTVNKNFPFNPLTPATNLFMSIWP